MFWRNHKLAIVLFISATGLLASSKAPAQSPSKGTPILEVVRISWSVERDEKLLYLRVYSDGLAEADPMRDVDFRDLKLKQKQLSKDAVAALTSLLADPNTTKLQEEYSSFWGNKDFGYKYEVTLAGTPTGKKIVLINFQPFLARKEGKPYPKQLEAIGCSIWRLRTEVSGESLEKDWLKGCADLGY